MTEHKQTGARPPAARRAKPRPRKRPAAAEIAWRDPLTWVTVVLLLAVGFGAAYAVWWRTWQLDQARELDWYVDTSQLRLREMRTRIDVFARQPDLETLAQLSLSASSLDGTLAQIPRRGPVEWRAEMVGLGVRVAGGFRAALTAQIAEVDEDALRALVEVVLPLRDALYNLDQALEGTVIRTGHDARRTNWTPEVTATVLGALQAARAEAARLPE